MSPETTFPHGVLSPETVVVAAGPAAARRLARAAARETEPVSDEHRTEAEGDEPATRLEQDEGARYPGHEDPETLRDRAGLGAHEGREAEVTPEVAADDAG